MPKMGKIFHLKMLFKTQPLLDGPSRFGLCYLYGDMCARSIGAHRVLCNVGEYFLEQAQHILC